MKLTRADFEKPVMYRGIRIDPLPREYYGEPSALVLAIRDEWIEKYTTADLLSNPSQRNVSVS
jgi:hypothetical protein